MPIFWPLMPKFGEDMTNALALSSINSYFCVMRFTLLLAMTAAIAAQSCTPHNSTIPEESGKMDIERYDLEVTAYPGLDSAARADFRQKYTSVNDIVIRLYAASHGITNPTATDSMLMEYARSRGVGMFGCAIRDRLGSLDSVETVLGKAAEQSKKIIPELKWPQLYGVISTYDQAIILSGDTLALIGTNHYLGADDEAYTGFDAYKRRNKCLEALPWQLTEAMLLSQAPYTLSRADATALSRMIYSGGVEWIVARLTDTDDFGKLLGWDDAQSKWAVENEGNAWNALISRKMLYSTDEPTAERLTQNAPATAILHPDAPGRMGTWLGMRIVDAYMKSHPDMKAWQLLQKDFYGDVKTLVESGYNPLRK